MSDSPTLTATGVETDETPRLFVKVGDEWGEEIPLEEDARFGRSSENDIILEGGDVSREHTEIRLTAEGVVVADLGSRNGTLVNGWPIDEAVLQDGDEIQIGSYTFLFRQPAAVADVGPDIPAAREAARRMKPRRSLAGDMPWVFLSLVVHAVVVLILGGITFARIPPPRKRIEIRTEFVEFKEDDRPVRRRSIFEDGPAPERGKGAGDATANRADLLGEQVPTMAIDRLTSGALRRALPSAGLGELDGHGQMGGIKLLQLVKKKRAGSYAEAIDDLALEVIDVIEGRTSAPSPLLVCIAFDKSLSLVADREEIADRIEKVTKTLLEHIGEADMRKLYWAVVGFSRRAQILMKPTVGIESMRRAIRRIPSDQSGVENCCAAVRFCISKFGSSRRKLFIVLVTDETGDDAANPQILEATVADLKKKRVRLYVFGRQANFSYPMAEEEFQGERVEVNRGPESPRSEFFQPDGMFVMTPFVPSGFGIYAHVRLATESRGQCYMLGRETAQYDEALIEQMAPEACSLQQYEARRRKSKLRNTLLYVISEWEKIRPPNRAAGDLSSVGRLSGAVLKAYQSCTEAASRLEAIRPKDRYSAKRWAANRDLAIAQLHKFRCLLIEYTATLRQLQQHGGVEIDMSKQFVGLLIRPDPRSSTPKGGARAARAKAEAMKWYDRVAQKYPRTPWAAVAKAESATIFPLSAEPRYRRPDAGKGKGKGKGKAPEPPKL